MTTVEFEAGMSEDDSFVGVQMRAEALRLGLLLKR